MASIKPFRALRFNPAKANAPLKALVCPPYDVIDAAGQEALLQKSPHNIVRIELAKDAPGDAPGNDRYSRAAAALQQWLAAGVVAPDAAPAFYIYEQTFDIALGGASRSQVVTRRGLFAAVKLEPFGEGCVFPHEETFGAPKADRLNLMRACAANISPVFGLVPDEDRLLMALLNAGVAAKSPSVEFSQDNGMVERLWVLDDAEWCGTVMETLRRRPLFIADGHHRYETCCTYRNERRAADGDPAGQLDREYEYTLMACVPMSDPGLYILPTHRLIQAAPGLAKDNFLRDAAVLFEEQDATAEQLLRLAEEQEGPVRFGVIFRDGSRKILSMLPRAAAAMQRAAPGKSDAWRGLDVAVLQELVLKGLLQLSEEQVLRKEGLSYTPDTRGALARVTAADSPYMMGFILRPTRIEQVRTVAAANEKMPQKSTFFFPKLLTGLVLRTL